MSRTFVGTATKRRRLVAGKKDDSARHHEDSRRSKGGREEKSGVSMSFVRVKKSKDSFEEPIDPLTVETFAREVDVEEQ